MLNVVKLSKMVVLGSILLASTYAHGMEQPEDGQDYQDSLSMELFEEKINYMKGALGSSPYRFALSDRSQPYNERFVCHNRISSLLDARVFPVDSIVKSNMDGVVAEYKEILDQPNFGLKPVENDPIAEKPMIESPFVEALKAKALELKPTSRPQKSVESDLSDFDIRW